MRRRRVEAGGDVAPPGEDGDRDVGTAQQPPPHKAWQARNAPSASRAPPGIGARTPLASLEVGEARVVNRNDGVGMHLQTPSSKHGEAMPRVAGTGKGSSTGDSGVTTLRCMYTNQKTKKRKVWSDGAVKCYPKRQRVCLYRWSEVLGVTDKLLSEIYLSVPEYDAFVTMGEPELEMELYIASMDGVIQNEVGSSSADTTASNSEVPAAVSGRKRKLLKPFKPPTMKAPPVASPAQRDDMWGPSGMMGQPPNGGPVLPRETESGAFAARTSYTGFGHVESLWGDEPDGEDPGVGLAGERGGWGPGGESDPPPHGGCQGGASALAEARWQHAQAVRSSSAASARSMSGYGWGQGDGRPSNISSHAPHDFNSGKSPACYRTDVAGEFAGTERPANGGRWHSSDDPLGGEPYHENQGRRSGVNRPPSPGKSTLEVGKGAYGAATVGGDQPNLEHPGHSPTGERRLDEGRFGRTVIVVPQHGTSPRDPKTGLDRGGGGGEIRSTQDILSMFGGFGETLPLDERPRAPTTDSEPKESTPVGLRKSSKISAADVTGTCDKEWHEPHQAADVFQHGGRTGRAADMRRAQKQARAAGVTAGASSEAADDANAASPEWSCDVCGVRGPPSSTKCRVCGAERQPPCSDAGGERGSGAGGDLGDGMDESVVFGGGHGTAESGRVQDAGDRQPWTYQGMMGGLGSQEADRAGTLCDLEYDSPGHSVTRDVIGTAEVGDVGRRVPDGRPLSRAGSGGWAATVGSGSGPNAADKRRVGGVRMEMDLGFSSDSDED